jgi:hypothetical protein
MLATQFWEAATDASRRRFLPLRRHRLHGRGAETRMKKIPVFIRSGTFRNVHPVNPKGRALTGLTGNRSGRSETLPDLAAWLDQHAATIAPQIASIRLAPEARA